MKLPYCLILTGAFFLWSCQAEHSPDNSEATEFTAAAYPELQVELEEMYDADQAIRQEVMQVTTFDEDLIGRMKRIDSVNQLRVNEILDHYGWIPSSRIGEKAADALFLVVQHGDVEMMEKYLPEIKVLAAKGEAKMTHAALMEDRILMYKGEKQIYGTQATMRSNPDGTSRSYIWPVRDPGKVNELRQEAGFDMSVEEYAKRLNAEYDPEEKLPAG